MKKKNRIACIFFLSIFLLNQLYIPNVSGFETQAIPQPKKIIIFIPGFAGTELYEDQAKTDLIWIDYFESNKLNFSNSLYYGLPLGWPGSKKFENIPQWDWLGTGNLEEDMNFYKGFADNFNRNSEYILDVFPYDWRKSNADNAVRLKEKIDQALSDNPDVGKVNIVAHSMGGIIAKKYILDHKNNTRVDKLITLGTPFFGAPYALQTLLEGYKYNGISLLGKSDIRTIPSLFELLPSKLYFNLNNTSYVGSEKSTKKVTPWTFSETSDFIRDNLDNNNLYTEALEFQDSMSDSVGNYVDFYRIVGDNYYTLGFMTKALRNSGNYSVKSIFLTEDVIGDGVVPLASATYGNPKTWYTKSNHEYMPSNYDVIDAVDSILNGKSVTSLDSNPTTEFRDGTKITIYNLKNGELQKNGLSTSSLNETSNIDTRTLLGTERFIINAEVILPTGDKVIIRDSEIISKPQNVELRSRKDVIEILIYDYNQYQLKVSKTDTDEQDIGMILTQFHGIKTSKEYKQIDLTKGNLIGHVELNEQDLGLDTNFDGSIDEKLFADNQDEPNDPSDPSNGDIIIDINGTKGKNDWFTSDISVSLETSIEIPVDEEENEETEEGEEPSEPVDLTPEISYSINDEPESSYSGSIQFGEDGKHTITAYVRDKEGNLLGQASKSFKIDKTSPNLSTQVAAVHGENGWLLSDAQISVAASDETSKLTRVDFNYNGRGIQTYIDPFSETNEGHHNIFAEAEDNAGKIEMTQHPFKIDKTKPVITDVYLQDEYYWDTHFPIQFDVSDVISGVNTIRATINGNEVQNGSTYHFTEPGWHTYRIEVKDYAGWKAVYETEFEVYIPATIIFKPEHLQLDQGEKGMATTFIQLPEPFQLENIKHSSITINEANVHIQDNKYGFVNNPIDDEDLDGQLEYMVKYQRESLIHVIKPLDLVHSSENPNAPEWRDTMIAVFGEWGEYHLKGYDSFIVTNNQYNPPQDITRPTITSVPDYNETNVSVDATPIITFSETVVLSSGGELSDRLVKEFISFTDSQGKQVAFTANWMINTLSVQINPSLQLKSSETYHIRVNENAFVDLANNGNELFISSFTTENRPIILDPPLPLPVIEPESGEIVHEETSSMPERTPSYEESSFTPILQNTVQLAENTAQLSDAELDSEMNKATETGMVILIANDKKVKMALSQKQLEKVIASGHLLQIKLFNVTFTMKPEAIQLIGSNNGYITLGAEAIKGDEKQKLISLAKNKEGLIMLGDEVFHLHLSLIDSENVETAINHFDQKIKVIISVPKEAHKLGKNGRLTIGRFNTETDSWEKYYGQYDERNGTFEFETDKFSNWTFVTDKRTFVDVTHHWAKEDIEYMANLGYINGLDYENFAPGTFMTRAQFATVLAEVLDLSETSDMPFIDVSRANWYYENINKVYTAGLVHGLDTNHFAPHEFITREQMAVMISNALSYKRKDTLSYENGSSLEGYNEVSKWAQESVNQLIQVGFYYREKDR